MTKLSKSSTKFVDKIKSVHLDNRWTLEFISINQIKGSNGGRISKPDAVACGTIYIVVGTGNAKERGGPSSNQILRSTTVAVVAANNVVPATVAIGNGGGGIRVPSAEAVGLVVPGKAGNPVIGKGEKKGFGNG